MKLLKLLTMDGLAHSHHLFARHVISKENGLADSLSRLDLVRFWKLAPNMMNKNPEQNFPEVLWPMEKIWFS